MARQEDLLYLDYAASTPVDQRVVEAMTALMTVSGNYANPSSTHFAGRQSVEFIAKAAGQLAGLLNTGPDQLIWTSGATESDNLAIMGAAHYRQGRGQHLITMRTEHKAVTDSFSVLERQGFEVTWLNPEINGLLDLEKLGAALRDDTQLVSVMHVNNETGAIQDISAIGALCHEHDALFHVDAAQSVGKVPIDLEALPVDLMSMTACALHRRSPGCSCRAFAFRWRSAAEVAPGHIAGTADRRLWSNGRNRAVAHR